MLEDDLADTAWWERRYETTGGEGHSDDEGLDAESDSEVDQPIRLELDGEDAGGTSCSSETSSSSSGSGSEASEPE